MPNKVSSVRNLVGRDPKRRTARKPTSNEAEKPAKQIESPELQGTNEVEQMPPAVVGERMAVRFVKFHIETDAEDNRTAVMEISLPISDECKKFIPTKVREAFEFLTRAGDKRHECQGVGAHYIELGLAPEPDDRDLEIQSAAIEKVQLAAIEETGSGKTKDAIRLSFRIIADATLTDVKNFCWNHSGEQIWLKLQPLQGSLL